MHHLIKNYNSKFKGNVHFCLNIEKKINQIIKFNKWKNLCLVVDINLLKLKLVKKLINSLKSYNLNIITCDISEPTYQHLEKKRIKLNKKDIDVFIGLGGGSAIDFAKGLSVLYTNKKSAIFYRGFNKFKKKIKPIVAIPTTAGTGSEITPNASFINLADKKKMGINGEAIKPKYALLNPKLTLSCPKSSTISSAVDSLVHATEAFVAKKTNSLSQIYAKEGFKLVFENLENVLKNPKNLKYRKKIMLGALLSAVGLMNSGTGPAAAMSYPTGVHYKVPHGIGGAIFLPYIIRYNISKGFYNYGNLYRKNSSLKNSLKERSIDFLNEVNRKWVKFLVPNNLNKLKLSKKKIHLLSNQTYELKGAIEQNPIKISKKEIFNLFSELSRVKLN